MSMPLASIWFRCLAELRSGKRENEEGHGRETQAAQNSAAFSTRSVCQAPATTRSKKKRAPRLARASPQPGEQRHRQQSNAEATDARRSRPVCFGHQSSRCMSEMASFHELLGFFEEQPAVLQAGLVARELDHVATIQECLQELLLFIRKGRATPDIARGTRTMSGESAGDRTARTHSRAEYRKREC